MKSLNEMKLSFHQHALILNFGRSFYLYFKDDSSYLHHGRTGILKRLKIVFTLNDVLHISISTCRM